MTDTIQKLREAIKRLLKAHRITVQAPPKTITDAENQIAEIQNAVKFAEEALALPTAEQVDDINVAESFTSVTKTAAPVGDLPELPELPEPAAWRTPDEWPMCYQYTHEEPDAERIQWAARYGRKHEQVFTADQMRAYARAALSAGDAGWQPIETAPKDGSDCWLLVEEEVRRGFWVEIEFEERRDLDGRYIDQTDDDAYWMDKDSGDSLEPTMFYPITKPLPPAPAMRKGQL